MLAGVPGCASVTPSLFVMLPCPVPCWFTVKIPGCACATTSDCGTDSVFPCCTVNWYCVFTGTPYGTCTFNCPVLVYRIGNGWFPSSTCVPFNCCGNGKPWLCPTPSDRSTPYSVISPPGAIGTPPCSLAACTTPCAVTVGVVAAGAGALTTPLKTLACPATKFPPCARKAVTETSTGPAVSGFHVPCQIPPPICVIATVSLAKYADTWACCSPGPTRVPHPSDTCTSIVFPCPTTAVKFGCSDRYCICNGCAAHPDAAFGSNSIRYPRSAVARSWYASVSTAAGVEPGGATTISTFTVCDGDPSENCSVMVPRCRLPAVNALKSGN